MRDIDPAAFDRAFSSSIVVDRSRLDRYRRAAKARELSRALERELVNS
jgi:hypothetical protein